MLFSPIGKIKKTKDSVVWFFFFFFFLSLFIWDRECACTSKEGTEREKDRENPKQAPCYQHRAWRWVRSHEVWYHDLSWNQESDAQPTEPPRCLLNTSQYLMWKVGTYFVLLIDGNGRTDVLQECIYQCQWSLSGDGVTANGSHFLQKKRKKNKNLVRKSFFFLVVLEFPFLDEFLTCVNLWKANYDFQCFSLKLPTRFSILPSPNDSILLEMLHETLFTRGVNWKEWIGIWGLDHNYLLYCLLHILIAR